MGEKKFHDLKSQVPMPYKKFKKSGRRPKRQYRKGKFSKKFKGRFRMNHRPKLAYSGPGRAPLPDYYFTKLHYQDWFNYSSSGSSGVGEIIFSGNGAYDPYDAIGGIGCSGFTELAAIYQQYRVYASKITVVVKSIVDSTATGDSVFLIIPDRNNVTYSMSDVIARQASPYSKVAMLNRGSMVVNPLQSNSIVRQSIFTVNLTSMMTITHRPLVVLQPMNGSGTLLRLVVINRLLLHRQDFRPSSRLLTTSGSKSARLYQHPK